MKQSEPKFDIQYVLGRLQKGDYAFIEKLSDEELKSINPFVVLMWAAAPTQHESAQKIVLDSVIEDRFFNLYNHPRLQLMMIASALEGFSGSYRFMRPPKKSEHDKELELLMREYSCSRPVAEEYRQLLAPSDMEELKSMYEEIKK